MANAYSKSRPKKLKQYPEVELTLGNKPDLPQDGQPYMPWMRAIDAHFEMFGFKPGDRVYLRFNFDSRRVIITPDYSALNWREQPYVQMVRGGAASNFNNRHNRRKVALRSLGIRRHRKHQRMQHDKHPCRVLRTHLRRANAKTPAFRAGVLGLGSLTITYFHTG
ncbi:hypothetical protein, partial [Burkholderia lata]|uniref:hypothetical protein n=1 Tax=Burkholderia lata (strain ATCC 17760 / DSM 23089 / LMG 22485 / NCIMB 9086 / R18194 / 383) TaxID=482957 RepID=UPI0020C702A5